MRRPPPAAPTPQQAEAAVKAVRARIRTTLVAWREKRGWSQKGAAQALGVSFRTVQRIEDDKLNPRLSTLVALAVALNAQVFVPKRTQPKAAARRRG